MTIDELKQKQNITRQDIADLLESIAPPGKKQKTKINTIKQLELRNSQGHHIADTLESYSEF